MFSAAVELILSVAWREATSRRHAHLTVEHLLFVLAHDLEGEKILKVAAADLRRLRADLEHYLQTSVERRLAASNNTSASVPRACRSTG